jgi:hypothetical protein
MAKLAQEIIYLKKCNTAQITTIFSLDQKKGV